MLAPAPPRDPVWGWSDALLFFGLAIPIMLLSEFLLMLAGKTVHIPPTDPVLLICGEALGYAAIFLLLAKILRMAYDAPFWRSLGWLPSGITMVTALTVGVLLAFGIAILGGLLHVENKSSEMGRLLSTPRGLIAGSLFAVSIAPLAEELIFRGFLQPLLIRSVGVFAGIAATSALFGLLHFSEYGNSWGSAALIGITGFVLGILRHISGSTRISAFSHMAYNGTMFLAFFTLGRISQH